MATQKQKLVKAHLMACSIKSIAQRIEFDAHDFGASWPKPYADQLRALANDYLNTK